MSIDLFNEIKGLAGNLPVGAFKALPPDRWDHVSFQGVQKAKVTAHSVGFDVVHQVATASWTYADLVDPSKVDTIKATIDAKGHATITLDGVSEANARIAVRPIIQLFSVKFSIELIYDLNGVRQDVRLDGRAFP